MARLSKEAWAKPSLKRKEVEVEELGGSVLVRELPAEYSAEVASQLELKSDGREQIAKIDTATMERLQFAYGVIDDNGDQLFTEQEAGDLAKKHGRAFKTVINVIDEISGIDKEAIEAAEQRFPRGNGSAGGQDVADGSSGGDSGPDVPARAGSPAGDAG